MFVEVTTPDTHVKDWSEASKAILECGDRAEKLLARSACCSHSLVYHQVLALVEHYFLSVLPVPSPTQVSAAMAAKESNDESDDEEAATAADAEDGEANQEPVEGPYTPRQQTNVSVQRDCLQALNDVMLLYVAAAKTTWTTDDAETEFLRLLTTGCIFAVFDAVLRMQALPAPTHLSAVYAGRAGSGPYANEQFQFAVSLKVNSPRSPLPSRPAFLRLHLSFPTSPHLSHFAQDFGQYSTLAKSLEISTLVSHPPILTTRCRLLAYFKWLETPSWQDGFKTQHLFDWKCGEDKVQRTNFEVEQTEDLLLSHVLVLHGLQALDMPTPGGTKPMLQAKNRQEAAGAWLTDGWTNNGIFAPEMAQLRDVAFLAKMMVADPHSLRESLKVKERGVVRESWLKKAIIYPSSLLPNWDVTSGVKLCLRWGPYADMVALHTARPFKGRDSSLATPTAFGIRPKRGQLNEDDVVHHLGSLPTFDGRLAEEDSERLMTYLVRGQIRSLVCLELGLFEHLLTPVTRRRCHASQSRWCSDSSIVRRWARCSTSGCSACWSGCSSRPGPSLKIPMLPGASRASQCRTRTSMESLPPNGAA